MRFDYDRIELHNTYTIYNTFYKLTFYIEVKYTKNKGA